MADDGSTTFNNSVGGTLTLQKNMTHMPSLVFKGLASSSLIEGGDAYLTAYVGGDRRLTILSNGNIGVGTTAPQDKFSVNGNIRAREIKVETANWPDYVFDKNYMLTSLTELEQYLLINKHLPDVPSADEIALKGLNLGQINSSLLKNIEELALHLIQKDKQLQQQSNQISLQEERILKLEAAITELLKKTK